MVKQTTPVAIVGLHDVNIIDYMLYLFGFNTAVHKQTCSFEGKKVL
jgi:hypothetical protein